MTATQENKCSICLKSFNDPRWMPCKHVYCFKCIPQLHRRDLDTKDQIVFECRICAKRYGFNNWSTLKNYVTLHCVPYVTALQFDKTPIATIKSSCSACFNVINRDSNIDNLEYCIHCNKKICHECLIDHRMELKKNILHVINQYRLFMRKHQQLIQQTKNKLENMKTHIDFCAFEFIDQIETYCEPIFLQIDEQKFCEETNSSSGYESLNEQWCSDMDYDMSQQSILQNNIILTEPSVIPIYLLGELISPDTSLLVPLLKSSTSQLLWSITHSFPPSHIVFESESSKLFICTEHGYVSVYSCTTLKLLLIDTFYLQYNGKSQPITIKSLTASVFSLIVSFNSFVESILHFYSHNGRLLHSLTLFNEYISQICFDHNYLWCLELISSTLFYYQFQSNNIINKNLPEKTQFISFKQQSFNPYRFASNKIFVAVMDRALTGIVLLFDRYTASYLKQIKSPLTNFHPCDIELTNQMLIYRFPHFILLTLLENEQSIEQINANRNLNITKGKSDTEVLISMSTDDNNTFIIQCYVT
ncbi:unnamed protein product [Rotaria sordida]|uniref:RING-type domain-containing protein n=1 Tax=Rotaria sordida TaxID=392033 RepID=A0A813RS21_9BILA|nr:unnamed protein product [Rotaria sordida]CAF3514809.1 unnamed protein product [Rotaria sordida]